ncbi:TPA: hypothetical protein SI573_004159 [Escherichia coli]|nr:hypothetical protein [Escherichia coli]HEI2379315.1 hypothetical protein [Escherichia coli]HEI2401729.1 hypothetical protein [Escherichia coli]HEI2419374.1 hypothetical protein [Escherichia coli]HEI2587580.1 hypothetical protein [Escherichia coli]
MEVNKKQLADIFGASMTVETARRILAAAPQSAQARSDTALDRLMQGAPAPLAAGNPASDAVNDLLNTPV